MTACAESAEFGHDAEPSRFDIGFVRGKGLGVARRTFAVKV